MRYAYITYLSIVSLLLLTSCNGESADVVEAPIYVPEDEPWEDEELDGPSATISPFLPGNEVARSTYAFNGQQLIFGWEAGDVVGLYPTAKMRVDGDTEQGLINPSVSPHPKYNAETYNIWRTDPTKSQQRAFGCPNSVGTQSANLYNNDPDFNWDDIYRWTAYMPFTNKQGENYENKTFSFEGQVQQGLPDMIAYAKYAYNVSPTENNAKYKASETKACIHLGKADALISPEMAWSGERINFQLRHVGAVARFYLLAPEDNLVITKLRLICDTPIFYTKGKFNLKSHQYQNGEFNYGVDLTSGDKQISPVGVPVKDLELDFVEGQCITTNNYTTDYYGAFGRYLIAYLMMYPVNYNPATHGKLYVYITGYEQGDAKKQERRFVTEPLAAMSMKSGYYYQWISATTNLEIELTATLLPWQDIVGGNINADLTK